MITLLVIVIVVIIIPKPLRRLHILLVVVSELSHVPIILIKEIVFISGAVYFIVNVNHIGLILNLLFAGIANATVEQPNRIGCVSLRSTKLFNICHIIVSLVMVILGIVVLISTLAFLFFLIEKCNLLLSTILSNNVFQYTAARFLLRSIQIALLVPLQLLLEPLLVMDGLLLVYLLFVQLRVINKSDRARCILSCWSMLKIASDHLLLHEFKCISRNCFRHHTILHALDVILEFITGYAFKHPLLMHKLRDYLLRPIYEGGGGNLTPHLVVSNMCRMVLVLIVLLRARLVLSILDTTVTRGSWLISVAPIKSIDHECHVSSAILLLLEVIEL